MKPVLDTSNVNLIHAIHATLFQNLFHSDFADLAIEILDSFR